MDRRIRLAGVTVNLAVLIDDGDNLIPTQVQPVVVGAHEWAQFAESGVQDALASMQAQLDKEQSELPSDAGL